MEEVLALCPNCAENTEHVLLKANETNVTACCSECNLTHSFSPPKPRFTVLPLVISDGDKSEKDEVETLLDEDVAIDDEFEHNGHRMLVTGMEGRDGRHHKKLPAREVKVLHAILFDTVTLKVSVNDNDVTRSYQMQVEPERPVNIGEIIAMEGKKFKVKTLKSDQNRTINRGFLLSRNIRRAFCDEVPHWVREGKIMPIRRRGKPPGVESQPRHGRKA